jgi:CrcB protein
MNYLLVMAGGGIGAVARYWMQGIVYRYAQSMFPYGTFMVNALGSLAIGFLMVSFEERFLVNPSLRLFLTVGILGGFTTFSSFSFETIALLRDGEMMYAAANVVGSVGVCLLSAYVGAELGKLV